MSTTVKTIIRIKIDEKNLQAIKQRLDFNDNELYSEVQTNRTGFLDLIITSKNQYCPERVLNAIKDLNFKTVSCDDLEGYFPDEIMIDKEDTDFFLPEEGLMCKTLC